MHAIEIDIINTHKIKTFIQRFMIYTLLVGMLLHPISNSDIDHQSDHRAVCPLGRVVADR
jgi:hypothetical protein